MDVATYDKVKVNEGFRALCKEKDLTLKEAAALIPVSYQTARAWSSGHRNMTVVYLEVLHKRLKEKFNSDDYLLDTLDEKS
jgi:transcriptional regulator with XRE-family HTH domain